MRRVSPLPARDPELRPQAPREVKNGLPQPSAKRGHRRLRFRRLREHGPVHAGTHPMGHVSYSSARRPAAPRELCPTPWREVDLLVSRMQGSRVASLAELDPKWRGSEAL